jgi:hypothetical protein
MPSIMRYEMARGVKLAKKNTKTKKAQKKKKKKKIVYACVCLFVLILQALVSFARLDQVLIVLKSTSNTTSCK